MSLSCFISWQTAQASAPMKPGKRFGFHLQCQLHPRAGVSLQFPEGTAPEVRPDLLLGAPGPSPTPIKPRWRHGSVEIDITRPVKAFDTHPDRS